MCLNKTYSEIRIGKHSFVNFPVQNGLKQGDSFSSLLFNFAFEYVIRKVQVNEVSLKLNGMHQLLVYADDINLLGDNVGTIKKNTETLINISKEVGLEVNTEKTKYMLLSLRQNAGRNHVKNIVIRCFENVALLKYLGITVTNQNLFRRKLRGD
jgi:hypothetical protein